MFQTIPHLRIVSCIFCAMIWSSTWIHISPAPVAAERPSSIKKKQSAWPQRLILTSSTSIAKSLVSFMINDRLRLDNCKSYWPDKFLLVPRPLGLIVTGQVETKMWRQKSEYHQSKYAISEFLSLISMPPFSLSVKESVYMCKVFVMNISFHIEIRTYHKNKPWKRGSGEPRNHLLPTGCLLILNSHY